MTTPAQYVDTAFTKAQNYADAAKTQLTSFLSAMSGAIYAAPTYSIEWTPVSEPTPVTIPTVPDALATISSDFKFDSTLASGKPADLLITAPTLTGLFPSFTASAPSLSMPTAPTISVGAIPSVPSLSSVTVPDAPSVTMPSTPSLMSLSTVTFGGVNLHTDMQAFLQTVPTFTLAAPTPFTHSVGPEYSSALLTNLQALINQRLAGGTGLPAAVEQAIWDRLRAREEAIGDANVTEVMRTHEALGFPLPSGALATQLRAAQQNYYDKLSEASRDISIKQADLEQANLKQAIEQGITLESKLVDYALQMEQLTFEISKAYAENAVSIYNAQVTGYQALLAGYEAYEKAYKTIIEAEMAQLEVYKAELSAEQTKAQINLTLVEQYKAQIEAGMAVVEIYKAQLSGTKALIDLEGAKISAAGQQIQAYVAGVNAQTAQVEMYKAGVSAEATKVSAYEGQVRAYAAQVSAASEQAQVNIKYFESMVAAKADEWRAWTARVQGETARVQAVAAQSSSILDGYRAALAGVSAQVDQDVKHWQTAIGLYSAQKEYTLSAQKLNSDAIVTAKQTQLEVGKVGSQVMAQLVGSAYGMIHTSASIDAKGSTSVSYNYSGATNSDVAPVTTA